MPERPAAPDPLPAETISEFILRMNRETSLRVAELHRALPGRGAGAWSIVSGPAAAFFRSYLLRGGILRGRRGFALSVLVAFSALVQRAKLWEYRSAPSGVNPPVDEEGIRAMELRYGP